MTFLIHEVAGEGAEPLWRERVPDLASRIDESFLVSLKVA